MHNTIFFNPVSLTNNVAMTTEYPGFANIGTLTLRYTQPIFRDVRCTLISF